MQVYGSQVLASAIADGLIGCSPLTDRCEHVYLFYTVPADLGILDLVRLMRLTIRFSMRLIIFEQLQCGRPNNTTDHIYKYITLRYCHLRDVSTVQE